MMYTVTMDNPSNQIDKRILERGYWVATHRLLIKKWVIVSFYIIIAFVYIVFFLQFGLYMYRFNEWDSLVGNAVQPYYTWKQIYETYAPYDIEFSDPHFFSVGDNRYDVVIEAYNPNKLWGVEALRYQFTANNAKPLDEREAFILPGERRYFTVLAYESQEPISSISFNVLEYRWRKVVSLPPLSWIFTKPPQFFGKQVTIDKGKQISIPPRVTWSVTNGSTFNIRSVLWQVGLYSAGRLETILEYQSERFPFLKERDFEIFIYSPTARVDQIKIFPIVNIFDPRFSYLDTGETE